MGRFFIHRSHLLILLAVVCAYVWSTNWYLESRAHMPRAGGAAAPLVATIESQVARAVGLSTAIPTGDGLEITSELSALMKKYDGKPLSLDAQTQTTGCRVNEALPDTHCTPGEVFATATVEDICTPGYSRSVRNVSVKTKRLQYEAYGFSYPQTAGSFEMDHLIPLELGGNNDIANLFPEAAEPVPGYHEKDLVENYLHAEVCAGVVSLSAAQEQIARDWLAVYKTLTPSTINTLKQQMAAYGD